MTEAQDTSLSAAQRCGFSRCRRPLPPPGPRGGRPYEFCPDRTWDGGKNCKQLAAAEQALHDALGETTDAAGMAGATDAFREQAERVVPQLGELANTVRQVQTRLESELQDAVSRAEQAEGQALEDRGTREAAERAEAEAVEAQQAAEAEAEQDRVERGAAENARDQAVTRARESDLERARTEATARGERDRADAAEQRASDERQRSEQAEARLAQRNEEHAALTAEHEVTVRAVEESREALRRSEERATAQETQLRAEGRVDRERLAEAQARLRDHQTTHHEQVSELREQLGAARSHAEAQTAEVAAIRTTVDRVRHAVRGDHDAEWLRRRVRAALDGQNPDAVSTPESEQADGEIPEAAAQEPG